MSRADEMDREALVARVEALEDLCSEAAPVVYTAIGDGRNNLAGRLATLGEDEPRSDEPPMSGRDL